MGYWQTETIAIGVFCTRSTLKWQIDTLHHLFGHTHTRIADFHCECAVHIGYIKSDMSCGSELDGIGNKVVDDLFYSIDIAFDHGIGTYELMLKEKPLVIDRLRGTVHYTA